MNDHKTVMVIEDEEMLLQAITKKLLVAGITAIPYASAEEAILKLNSGDPLPNAIWLDLKGMDGLGFMSAIKTDEKLSHIPIIVVSNSASDEKVHNLLALGAKKYLLKAQYRLDDIVNVFKEFIDEPQA